MTATTFYRIAAVLLVFFAVAHTTGFQTFVPDTADGAAVRDAMRSAQFLFGGRRLTYQQFYDGFGFSITAYLTFSALVAWQLGNLARTNAAAVVGIGWTFFAVQLATLVISGIYFAAPQVITSALVSVTAGVAALRTQRAA